jgi:PilZ domain
MEVGGLAM